MHELVQFYHSFDPKVKTVFEDNDIILVKDIMGKQHFFNFEDTLNPNLLNKFLFLKLMGTVINIEHPLANLRLRILGLPPVYLVVHREDPFSMEYKTFFDMAIDYSDEF